MHNRNVSMKKMLTNQSQKDCFLLLAFFLHIRHMSFVGWIFLAVCIWFEWGCLMYPDIEVEQQTPNHQPEISIETVEPQDNGIFLIDLECEKLVFRVDRVIEKDIEDNLYVGWYLNWKRENRQQPDWGWNNLTGMHDEEIRPGPDLVLPHNYVEENKIYTLRVFIADRPPNIPQDPNKAILDFMDRPEGKFDTYQWTFQPTYGSGFCKTQ